MKKIALIFIVAVIIPSGALAWLAFRSLQDEQLVVRARQTQLYQTVADSFVKQTDAYIAERQREFANAVESMLASCTVPDAATTFDERIRKLWPLAEVGFAVSTNGNVASPNMLGRVEGRRFRVENDLFLCSKESIEVYVSTVKGSVNLRLLDEATGPDEKTDPGKLLALKGKARTVEPAEPFTMGGSAASKVASAETAFRDIIGARNEGILARFLQNKLHVMMWYRSTRDYNTIFGVQVDLRQVRAGLQTLLDQIDPGLRDELCVAVLDEGGRPAALSLPGFRTDWKRPFAAGEIGEMLPHWEIAVYPRDPVKLKRAAASVRFTIGVVIAALLGAIAAGSFFLLLDLRRQFELARQKSDFVSNVSHELKTPLTSIRMFSELLAEGRVADQGKQYSYLKIISAETARLTRLINNILDFARMEKREKKYRFEDCDLGQIARESFANFRPQLEEHGFTIVTDLPDQPWLVSGEADALAQVILNLVSNAEKYSGEQKEIGLELRRNGDWVELRVLDRGLGVPAGAGEKIFEQFFRAHDSLNSGIQGSGLGLTLARQIARGHRGDVTYEPRSGGGSIFTLKLPAQ